MIEDRLLRVLVAGQRAFPNLTRHAAGAALAVTFSALTIIYATEHYVIGRGIDTYAIASADTEPATVPAVIPPPQPAAPREAQPPPAASVAASNAPPPKPMTRREMVMRLQAGLRQAGCYSGSVNGTWNTATQRAMNEFSTATNSRLPVNQPSEVLLALIDANGSAHCGVDPVVEAADPIETAAVPSVPRPQAAPPSSRPPEAADPVAALIAGGEPDAANAAAIDPATGAAVAAGATAAAVSRTALAADSDPAYAPPAEDAEPAAKPRKPATNAQRADRPKKRRTSKSQDTPSKIAKSFFKGIQKAFSGF